MKVRKVVGAAVTSTGLVLGMAGFAGATSGNIGNTGPGSWNKIGSYRNLDLTLLNHNDLDVTNHNHQFAKSGDAKVMFNTTGGGAHTGSTANHNSSNVSASVSNAGLGAAGLTGWSSGSHGNASIHTTGPWSHNSVSSYENIDVFVKNDNNVDVSNYNNQYASSGDAKVFGNTSGGSATTGNASNTNTQSVNLNVRN